MDAISSAYWNNKPCNPLSTTHLKKKARRGLEVICINIHEGGKPWHILYLIPCNYSAVYRTHFWKFLLELFWMLQAHEKGTMGPYFYTLICPMGSYKGWWLHKTIRAQKKQLFRILLISVGWWRNTQTHSPASLSHFSRSGFNLHMFLKLRFKASKREMVVWLKSFP